MNLVRWNDPFAGLTSLHSQLDDMFNELFTQGTSTPALPRMDVYNDNDKQLVAEVEAPGFNKDDVEVSVHEGVLEIKGEKKEKEEHNDKKRTYMVRESSSSFYRRIALPRHADADKVEANFDNGVLKVTIPFKELPKPKKIAIKAKNK
jgi:HSP20 family protein